MKFRYDSTVRNNMEDVWAFIMDFSNRPSWIHFFDKSFVSHQTEGWIGTKYKDKLTFLGIPLFIENEIVEYEENSHWRSKCEMAPFYPKLYVEARDNGDGTIYSCLEFELKLGGAFRLVPKSLIQKQVDNLVNPIIDRYIEILDKPNV